MSSNSYPIVSAHDELGYSDPASTANPPSDAGLREYLERLMRNKDRSSGVIAQGTANSIAGALSVPGSMGPPALPARYKSPTSLTVPSQTSSNASTITVANKINTLHQLPLSIPPRFPTYLPSGWLPETSATNRNPNQIWNLVYRPGINGEYCQHPIHSARNGTRHLLIPTEPVVRSRTDLTYTQSAVCWLTMYPKNENAHHNPSDLSERDYEIYNHMPSLAEVEAAVHQYGAGASLYLDKAVSVNMPPACNLTHTEDAIRGLDAKQMYVWASMVFGETIYMCPSCMTSRGWNSNAEVFAKYGVA